MTLFKKPASIRGALLALLLPAGIGLMALAWLVHGLLLDRMSREFIESRLEDEVAFLEHQIRELDGRVEGLQTGDYFEEVFHHAYAIRSPTHTDISPGAWASVLEPLLQSERDGPIRVKADTVPGGPSDVLAYRNSFMINEVPLVIIVSEDMGALKSSQAELHVWTAVVSLLLIMLLVGFIWTGITLSLRPVVAIQAALKRLQGGEIERIKVQAPDEFRSLVHQLNQLLDSIDQRLERSRVALANLSHSVKTPTTAVRQILEDTSRPLDNNLRYELGLRLGDIDRQLEAEMRRSSFAGPQLGKKAHPVSQARDLLWMLGRLYLEKSFELSTGLAEERRWPIEEHDLNEILGNLLDNAAKWSHRCVELSLEENSEQIRIVIGDDGPGVSEEAVNELGKRGLRLDEQTPGHGLGLAIVSDIVERYKGRIRFGRTTGGGLNVVVEFEANLPR